MPIGETRAWIKLLWARFVGDEDMIDSAGRQMDQYQMGFLRKAEQSYNMRLAQMDGFYYYNVLPQVPEEMSDEEAFRGAPPELCNAYFYALHRCHFRVTWGDRVALRYFHTRMHTCKSRFEDFVKCVVRRDVHVLRNIESWEKRHLKKLTSSEREEYADKIKQKSEYYDYMASVTDLETKIACYYEKRQKEFRRRRIRSRAAVDEIEGREPTYAPETIAHQNDITKSYYRITTH